MKIDMQFEGEEQEDRKKGEQRKKYFRRIDPTKDLIIKIFIICAVIDIPLGAYFYYKKTHEPPQVEKQQIKQVERKIVQPTPRNTYSNIERRKTVRSRAGERIMYSWVDEKGHKNFSNVGFPQNKKYTEGKIEWY